MALAISSLLPKSWVRSFTYGVSPQPAHAPENSRYGVRSCEPLILSAGIRFSLGDTFVFSHSSFGNSESITFSMGVMVNACPGHISEHDEHPRQSSVKFCILNLYPIKDGEPTASFVTISFGAAFASSVLSINGRIAACGHTRLHSVHSTHLSASHTGTLVAMRRCS